MDEFEKRALARAQSWVVDGLEREAFVEGARWARAEMQRELEECKREKRNAFDHWQAARAECDGLKRELDYASTCAANAEAKLHLTLDELEQAKGENDRECINSLKNIRHWYIQKPIAHNCPLTTNGAVFQEFQPTVSEQNCEWVRVYSADDIQKKIGMGVTRYCEVMAEVAKLKLTTESLRAILLEWLASTPTDKDGNYDPINQPQAYKARQALEDGGET